MFSDSLYINEDNLIRWDKVRRVDDQTYVNAGTFTWSLTDADGVELASGNLSHVAGNTKGRWQGLIDQADAANLVEGDVYYVKVTGNDGADANGFRVLRRVARYHGE